MDWGFKSIPILKSLAGQNVETSIDASRLRPRHSWLKSIRATTSFIKNTVLGVSRDSSSLIVQAWSGNTCLSTTQERIDYIFRQTSLIELRVTLVWVMLFQR